MNIEFKKSFEKDLRKIDKVFHRLIFHTIEELKSFPKVSGCKKLQGTKSYYRSRIGNYRIIFQVISKEKRIIVYHVAERSNVYRNF